MVASGVVSYLLRQEEVLLSKSKRFNKEGFLAPFYSSVKSSMTPYSKARQDITMQSGLIVDGFVSHGNVLIKRDGIPYLDVAIVSSRNHSGTLRKETNSNEFDWFERSSKTYDLMYEFFRDLSEVVVLYVARGDYFGKRELEMDNKLRIIKSNDFVRKVAST